MALELSRHACTKDQLATLEATDETSSLTDFKSYHKPTVLYKQIPMSLADYDKVPNHFAYRVYGDGVERAVGRA